VTLLHPAALYGLLLLPLLLLLRRWRGRPRTVVWPSLLLWRAVEQAPPATRRRIDPLLRLELAAIALLCLAAASPQVQLRGSVRRLVVLVDKGPHMRARLADGRTAAEATEEEIRRVEGAYDESVRIPVEGDLVGAAVAAREGAVLLATDREGVRGPGYLTVGRTSAGRNTGIDAIEVRGDRLWFALATDGPPHDVRVRVGESEMTVRTGVGVECAWAPRIELLDRDNYDGDDAVDLRPSSLVARNATGSALVDAALFHAGVPATAGDDAALVIAPAEGEAIAGEIRGDSCTVPPGLFDGLMLDECAWENVRTASGTPLLLWRGRAIAAWSDDSTLRLGMPVDREWDSHGTLAVMVERAKRARAPAGAKPAFVDTRGVDAPWDGRTLPPSNLPPPSPLPLRPPLAAVAALLLLLILRAIVWRR